MKTLNGQPSTFIAAAAVLASLMLLPVTDAWSQQKASDVKQQIVGVWKAVSATTTGVNGVTTNNFGPNLNGEIIFTSDGHYSVLLTNPATPKFASGNRYQGTTEENKAVVQGSIAHFGTYSVSPDGKVLTLKIEGSSWPSWVGTQQKRDLTIVGDQLNYAIVDTAAIGGGTSELTYKRVK